MLSLSVSPRFSLVSVVRLAEVSVVVGDLCSVLLDALWLCTTLLQPVLTCVAAYRLKGDVYHCIVLHGELQTATTVKTVHIDQAVKLPSFDRQPKRQAHNLTFHSN